MKKYFKNRYISFLKTLKEDNQRKKEEEEKAKQKEERRKQKMLQKLGMENVQSRFLAESVPNEAKEEESGDTHRVASISKKHRSDKTEDLKVNYSNQVGTPKNSLRNRLTEVKEFDHKLNNEERKKEIKIKKENNDRIRKKQEEYLKSLADKKRLESEKEGEERRRQEQLKINLRNKVKDMLGNIERKPKEDEEEEQKEDKDNKKLNPSDLENFFKRNLQTKKVYSNITDFDRWKKRNKVDPKTKVYICTGGYGTIRKALNDRGWVENKDPKSPWFDLKWTLRAKDLDHPNLQSHQIVNHFWKSTAITTKVGLCHSLKNLIWFNNVDIDTFYPQCFDLMDRDDFEEFTEQFKAIKAEWIVKRYAFEIDEVDLEALKVSMKIWERRLMDLDDIIDLKNPPKCLVSDEEWELIAKDELNKSKLAKKKHSDWMKRMDWWKVSQHPAKKEDKKKRKAKTKNIEGKDMKETIDENDEDELREKSLDIWDRLKKKFIQYDMNGMNNIWIVKPAGLSRGRGIEVFASLVEILDNCHREGQWVAQKYMENPMIIHGRKFDIRQWVLVTSWNPLTIWFWNKPYIRFPAAEYDPKNLSDRFVHLTNNSVAKYAKNCQEMGEGNMWDTETFADYLQQEYGNDVWEEGGLRKRMQQVVKYTLEAVQDMFDENNKNATWTELYGFDLMLDDKCNPWLLEVNSSPTMEFSTSITEFLCKKVMEDTVKVIVDYHYAKKKSKIDTGDWQLICKKKTIESNPINSWGLNLVWEGVKMKVKKQKGSKSSLIPIKELSLGIPEPLINQPADEAIDVEDIDEVDGEDGEGEDIESEDEINIDDEKDDEDDTPEEDDDNDYSQDKLEEPNNEDADESNGNN
jgi:tubulin monoglycylase TTLL3/8